MPRSTLLALLMLAPLSSLAGPAASTSTAVPVPARMLEETRQIVEQLVSVDTSHGHETDALEPIATRLRGAGLNPQILESAPGRGNLVVRLRGDGTKKPLLLLAHVDVVPVEGQPWTVPAFKVTEKDGWLYGRGINDDKGQAAMFVAITLELAREKAKLHRDVILALTAGEETGGGAGVAWLVQKHPELLDAEFAFNEGGGARLAPGGEKVEFVGLGVVEKTFQSYRVTVKGPGGHSSMPSPKSDIVPRLARALVKVSELRFTPHALAPVRDHLELEVKNARTEVGAAIRKLLAGKALSPAEDDLLAADSLRSALFRTTCVTTMLQASPQDNVLPTSATATVNCRVMPDETTAAVRDRLAAAIGDPAVVVEPAADFTSSPVMSSDDAFERTYREIVGRYYLGAPIIHPMLTGASDSRFLRNKGVRAYGVVDRAATEEESMSGHTAHGPDERREIRWFATALAFLRELTRTMAM
ncbi:MAG TPA: M20/M25/M40 family metallo-hydrolase [Myxococcaceae bacterium]|jgi:acetylornithine deacetylase/succinyl-diaminopimelate desuccinylase-like protein